MLVVMGKNLLTTQQQLLATITGIRTEFDKFNVFMEINTAHLPDVDDKSIE